MFSPKAPAERESFGFDYVDLVPNGVTAVSAVVTIEVIRGTDPAASSMLLGSPSCDGTEVFFVLRDGVEGVIYCIHCLATMSDGQVLELKSDLLVTDAC